jgi:hypothetical protein
MTLYHKRNMYSTFLIKLYKEGICGLYSHPDIIISVIKLVIEWPGILHAWGIINVHNIWVETSERKRSLGRAGRKWEGSRTVGILRYVVVRRTRSSFNYIRVEARAGSCKHGSETFGSMSRPGFISELRNHKVLKKYAASWNIATICIWL